MQTPPDEDPDARNPRWRNPAPGTNPFQVCLDQAGLLVACFDLRGLLQRWSPVAERITGFHHDKVIGSGRAFTWLFPSQRLRRRILTEVRSGRAPEDCITRVRSLDGGERRILWEFAPMEGLDGGFLAIGRSIAPGGEDPTRIQRLAFYDPLTGLPNRNLFQDRLQQSLDAAARTQRRVAVMFLDLDGFKAVNDTLGHEVGDLLLREVGRRLDSAVRRLDTAARLGGDEFVVLLPGLDEPATASRVAAKILERIREPLEIHGHRIQVAASIGISVAPDDAAEVSELLHFADLAMYRAKQGARGGFQYYTEEMDTLGRLHSALEAGLEEALEQEQFELYYQPIVELSNGRPAAVEALVRWQHPRRGLLYPREFLKIVEASGHLCAVGDWILRQACAEARHLKASGHPMPVTVNISRQQLRDEDLPQRVARILHQAGLQAPALRLEIGMDVLTAPEAQQDRTLEVLHRMGIPLCLDGLGSAAFDPSRLRTIPFEFCKIDAGLGRASTHPEFDGTLLTALIALARRLGHQVVVKGVENPELIDLLKTEGCDLAQGYWFAVPADAEGLDYLLRSQAPSKEDPEGGDP